VHTHAPLSIFQRRKEDEETDRINEIERRVLAGQLSHEDAILARQRLIEENAVQAAGVKAERVRLEAMCVDGGPGGGGAAPLFKCPRKGKDAPTSSSISAFFTLEPPIHQDGAATAAGR
jgi:hypothetical protein